MSRSERLSAACRVVNLYVATWSPGDGVTRYRFFDSPGNAYCGPANGIFTALGYREACAFARGRGAVI